MYENLKYLYETNCKNNKPFVCEEHNRHTNLMIESPPSLFIPGLTIFGSEKGNEQILKLVEYLKELNAHGHFSNESKLKGTINYKLREWVDQDIINLVPGEVVGIKSQQKTNRY